MLISLELKNFRKHEDRTFTFEEGLVALRGLNEAGKSSALEAIAYSLFGSKALRDALENVVTWGKPVKDLRASLTVKLSGRTLTFVRHKGGAEVIENGAPIVTGQTEVSNFAAEMLGGDLATCNKLLFANQGSLRGALNEGNKAVAELIENLADFDLFDRLIDLIQHKLVVGSPDVVQARLKQSEDALAALHLPPKPEADTRIPTLEAEKATIEAKLATAQQGCDEYDAYFRQHLETWQEKQKAEASLAKLAADTEAAKANLVALEAQPVVVTIDVAPLQQRLANAQQAEAIMVARNVYNSYPVPSDIWEGDEASLDAAIQKARGVVEESRVAIATAEGEIKTLQAKIITSLICPTCGSALKDAEDIARRNAEHEVEIARLRDVIAATKTLVAESTAHVPTMLQVKKAADRARQVITQTRDWVEVGEGTVPPTLTWKGPETISGDRVDDIKRLIKEAEATWTAKAKQEGAIESAKKWLLDLTCTVIDVPKLPDDWDERSQKHTEDLVAKGQAQDALNRVETDLRIAKAEVAQAEAEYRAKIAQYQALEKEIAERKADLDALSFNNTLLKKIRAARPQVADKLWGMVLASVSSMFSTMRGEASVVAKSKDGFSVNGAPVSSLSGSTLDLLALAIRVALTRTFIPQASFLILDEVTAACDSERTLAMLGFLSAAGFKQTVLVSHEGVVDGVADVLIQL